MLMANGGIRRLVPAAGDRPTTVAARATQVGILSGGELHWLITPFGNNGRPPTYGLTSALVHFEPAKKVKPKP